MAVMEVVAPSHTEGLNPILLTMSATRGPMNCSVPSLAEPTKEISANETPKWLRNSWNLLSCSFYNGVIFCEMALAGSVMNYVVCWRLTLEKVSSALERSNSDIVVDKFLFYSIWHCYLLTLRMAPKLCETPMVIIWASIAVKQTPHVLNPRSKTTSLGHIFLLRGVSKQQNMITGQVLWIHLYFWPWLLVTIAYNAEIIS